MDRRSMHRKAPRGGRSSSANGRTAVISQENSAANHHVRDTSNHRTNVARKLHHRRSHSFKRRQLKERKAQKLREKAAQAKRDRVKANLAMLRERERQRLEQYKARKGMKGKKKEHHAHRPPLGGLDTTASQTSRASAGATERTSGDVSAATTTTTSSTTQRRASSLMEKQQGVLPATKRTSLAHQRRSGARKSTIHTKASQASRANGGGGGKSSRIRSNSAPPPISRRGRSRGERNTLQSTNRRLKQGDRQTSLAHHNAMRTGPRNAKTTTTTKVPSLTSSRKAQHGASSRSRAPNLRRGGARRRSNTAGPVHAQSTGGTSVRKMMYKYCGKAEKLEKRGHLNKAIAYYRKALEVAPPGSISNNLKAHVKRLEKLSPCLPSPVSTDTRDVPRIVGDGGTIAQTPSEIPRAIPSTQSPIAEKNSKQMHHHECSPPRIDTTGAGGVPSKEQQQGERAHSPVDGDVEAMALSGAEHATDVNVPCIHHRDDSDVNGSNGSHDGVMQGGDVYAPVCISVDVERAEVECGDSFAPPCPLPSSSTTTNIGATTLGSDGMENPFVPMKTETMVRTASPLLIDQERMDAPPSLIRKEDGFDRSAFVEVFTKRFTCPGSNQEERESVVSTLCSAFLEEMMENGESPIVALRRCRSVLGMHVEDPSTRPQQQLIRSALVRDMKINASWKNLSGEREAILADPERMASIWEDVKKCPRL